MSSPFIKLLKDDTELLDRESLERKANGKFLTLFVNQLPTDPDYKAGLLERLFPQPWTGKRLTLSEDVLMEISRKIGIITHDDSIELLKTRMVGSQYKATAPAFNRFTCFHFEELSNGIGQKAYRLYIGIF